jgi:hypothetical protein
MVSPETGIPKTKGKGDRGRRLTIMVLGDVRKVRTFECSRIAIVLFTVVLCAYLVFSFFVLYRFFNLRMANDTNLKRLVRLEQEATMMRKARDQSRERVALLKDYLESIEGRRTDEEIQEKEATPPKYEAQPKPYAATQSKPVPQGQTMTQSESVITERIVEIRDMTLRIEGSRLLIDFKLYRVSKSEPVVKGYVLIVVRDKHSSPPRELAFPYAEMKNGMPVNYRRGQVFEIKRFKPIHGNFPLPSGAQSYSTVTVLVFFREGTLIHKEEFEVNDFVS